MPIFPMTKFTVKKTKFNNQGAAALLTVIIVSAAVLIMAYSASVLGLGELDMGYTSQRSAETSAVADGCLEEALRSLKINSNYTGSPLSLGHGSCIISVTGAGSSRIIAVTSTVSSQGGAVYYKKIQAEITLVGNVITVVGWREM